MEESESEHDGMLKIEPKTNIDNINEPAVFIPTQVVLCARSPDVISPEHRNIELKACNNCIKILTRRSANILFNSKSSGEMKSLVS